MKKIILITFFLTSIASFSQTIRFNKTYLLYSVQDSHSVLLDNDNYIVLGGSINYASTDQKLKIIIYNIDSLGNENWFKLYGDSIYDYYYGTRNSLIKNSYGGYSLAGSRENDTVNMCMLWKFDTNFDTLWTRSYFVDTNFTVFYNHIQTADGGYALVGCYGGANYDGDALLVKTDSLGNMQWYKTYGTTGAYSTDYGFCIVATPDGGYLIGGSSYGYGNNDGYLIKTDSIGNKEWTQHYGSTDFADGTIFSITHTIDSGYVFGLTTYGISPVSSSFYNKKYNIIKLDKNFNELWNKQYGTVAEYTALGAIIEAEDGNLFATIEDDHICGLFKLTANGDSIWKRYYYPNYDYSQTNYEGGLLSLKQTADGGVIMAGVAYPPQQMWLVKVDSCGCDTAGCCNTGIPYYFLPAPEVTIYPNPATDNLTVSINNKELRMTSVSIIDIMGKEVLQVAPRNHSRENGNPLPSGKAMDTHLRGYVKIGVGNLPAGVYFVKVATNKGTVVKKFVKQ